LKKVDNTKSKKSVEHPENKECVRATKTAPPIEETCEVKEISDVVEDSGEKPEPRSMWESIKQKPIENAILGVAAIILVILLIAFLPRGSAPEEIPLPYPELRDVFVLQDPYNMTVVVVFDEEMPLVQFIAPNGELIDMENIRNRPGGNFIQFFLPNATEGAWQMNYDPLSNLEILSHYSVYMEHIFIRDFSVSFQRDTQDNLPIHFMVSADENGEFRYYLHAVFTADDNSIEEEILLARGYALLNQEVTIPVNDAAVSEMDGFMLRLSAYVQHGQAAMRDTSWLDFRLTGW